VRATTRRHRSAGPAKWRLAAGLVALALVALAALSGAQELGVDRSTLLGAPAGRPLGGAELDRATEELASKMRCPVCQGLSVADSPTESAQAMKEEAREFLAQGYTPTQVLDYFERSYGEFILLAPKREGLNWAVWLLPVAALGAGGWLIASRVRRGGAPSAEAGDDAELAEYLARVRRETAG
jgi:cytochrome c-type biogenesis protein CcmH